MLVRKPGVGIIRFNCEVPGIAQTPENMAATIYHSLGIPSTAVWHDEVDRPHHIYHSEPIEGLLL